MAEEVHETVPEFQYSAWANSMYLKTLNPKPKTLNPICSVNQGSAITKVSSPAMLLAVCGDLS